MLPVLMNRLISLLQSLNIIRAPLHFVIPQKNHISRHYRNWLTLKFTKAYKKWITRSWILIMKFNKKRYKMNAQFDFTIHHLSHQRWGPLTPKRRMLSRKMKLFKRLKWFKINPLSPTNLMFWKKVLNLSICFS